MRIAELDAREDHDRIAGLTLSDAWSSQYGHPVSVTFGRGGSGQRWYQQSLLSAWITAAPGPEVRRFLADGFRHTAVKRRRSAQWLLGTSLATRAGITLTSKPVFRVDPGIPESHNMMILPGNRRIRFFDFSTNKSRVVLKHGFDDGAMTTELGVRGAGLPGPFPPILESGPGWFEEEIVDGFTVSRCPPRLDRARIEAEAVERLELWAQRSRAVVSTESYVSELMEAIENLAPGSLPLPANLPAAVAERAPETVVQDSHGDFQPGNIIVDRRGNNPLIIDWEYHSRRSRYYDRIVFALGLRWPQNLDQRLRSQNYCVGAQAPALLHCLPSGPPRRSAIVVALLEDVVWRLGTWRSGSAAAVEAGPPNEVGPVMKAIWGAFPV